MSAWRFSIPVYFLECKLEFFHNEKLLKKQRKREKRKKRERESWKGKQVSQWKEREWTREWKRGQWKTREMERPVHVVETPWVPQQPPLLHGGYVALPDKTRRSSKAPKVYPSKNPDRVQFWCASCASSKIATLHAFLSLLCSLPSAFGKLGKRICIRFNGWLS